MRKAGLSRGEHPATLKQYTTSMIGIRANRSCSEREKRRAMVLRGLRDSATSFESTLTRPPSLRGRQATNGTSVTIRALRCTHGRSGAIGNDHRYAHAQQRLQSNRSAFVLGTADGHDLQFLVCLGRGERRRVDFDDHHRDSGDGYEFDK